MINTILFDLDGTLLPMDLNKFMTIYFKLLAKHLQESIDPNKITDIMMECTTLMVNNTEPIINQEVFMKRFSELVGGDSNLYLAKFHEFYDNQFQEVQKSTWQNEDIIKSVKLLKEKGYKIVLATNPLFPMRANHHRIRWAGFKPDDFIYISSFEKNSYCKPHLEYYKEVLSEINKLPDECMMVGNDAYEDMVSGKLGLKTFLITDCLVNKHDLEIKADNIGTYKEFNEFAKNLEKVA
ncbi:HAD family hydrolase [Mycoplasmatota bacterium WC30]